MEKLSKNKIKWIRSLRLKKNRDLESAFVVEGDKMVKEILEHWPDLILCLCTSNIELQTKLECYFVESQAMKELSSLSTPSELLVVVKKPQSSSDTNDFILAIDGIQDPGNMGTIIRTADWFGVDKIICSKDTVDIFNSKVIQSSMGSLFRVPIEYTELSDYLNNSTLPIYGALLNGQNLYKSTLSRPCILVVGNEGKGISDKISTLLTEAILIPGKGQAESLNVAVATGILLGELSK